MNSKTDELIELVCEKGSSKRAWTSRKVYITQSVDSIDEGRPAVFGVFREAKERRSGDHATEKPAHEIQSWKWLEWKSASGDRSFDLDQFDEDNPALAPEFETYRWRWNSKLCASKRKNSKKSARINPMAMEAYDEIKARLWLYSNSQKKNRFKAKESLLFSTISKWSRWPQRDFLDAFAKIKEEFVKVFVPSYRQEIVTWFSSSIRITLGIAHRSIAKPKGKRPLTINNFRVGRRLLTCHFPCSFSTTCLKPAPSDFDEVDAPLADAK